MNLCGLGHLLLTLLIVCLFVHVACFLDNLVKQDSRSTIVFGRKRKRVCGKNDKWSREKNVGNLFPAHIQFVSISGFHLFGHERIVLCRFLFVVNKKPATQQQATAWSHVPVCVVVVAVTVVVEDPPP